jgi:VWFA-related protein
MSHKIQRRLPGPALLAVGLLLTGPLSIAQAAPNSGRQTPPDASASAPPSFQLQVQVPLVLEDLVVQDRNGNPVHGLKESNLTVTEDAKPVTLRSLKEQTQVPERSAAPALPNLGPNTFTNSVAAPENSPLNILLLDVLNIPMADQEAVRQQMLKYLGTVPPGVPVAIFQLDTELHLLQGFTADPDLLRAAIDKGRNIVRSPRMTDTKTVSDIDPMRYDYLSDVVKGLSPQSINDIKRVEAARQASGDQERAILTQQALIQLGRYLSGLPGRKSLIWFSASFPLGTLPDILVRNRVAVYPVDARGVMPVLTSGRGTGAALSAFDQSQMSQHNAMARLAQSTGGEAFYDTNDFKKAAAKAVSDGDNYYTLAYTPPNQRLDGTYRRVAMQVDRPGLRLAYRTGYFADNPNVDAHGPNAPLPNALQTALMPGSPVATQILFDVQVSPEDAPVNAVTTGARPVPALMKPPYRRYDLHYQVAVGDTLFAAAPDGARRGSLNFAVLVYSSEGALVNEIANKVNLDWPPARYAEMVKRGLRVGQIVEAPAKGDYFLRIVVYDPNGNRAGATEVPLADLKTKQAMPNHAQNNAQPATPK